MGKRTTSPEKKGEKNFRSFLFVVTGLRAHPSERVDIYKIRTDSVAIIREAVSIEGVYIPAKKPLKNDQEQSFILLNQIL